jgi:hypothetical protein
MPKKRQPFRSIATRLLRVGGSRDNIKVELGKPYPSEKDYGCDFKITYKGKVFRHATYGVDAFQSLQLALRLLPTFLRTIPGIPLKKVYLWEPGDDMGFAEVYK